MKNLFCLKRVLLTGILFIFFVSQIFSEQKVSFDSTIPSKAPRNPKISDVLDQSISFFKSLSKENKEAYTSLKKSPTDLKNFPCRFTENNEVQVYIYLKSLDDGILKKLEKSGVKIQIKSEERTMVQAFIPVEKIDQISNLSDIYMITLPSYAVNFRGVIRPQCVKDKILGTDKANEDFNIDASNVKVGVISDGIDFAFNSMLTGDLESTPTFTSFIDYPNSNPYYAVIYGYEGTALMELVNDIAPKVQFFFANCLTDVEMIYCKKWLAGENIGGNQISPCNIVFDDLGFFAAGPLNGDSEVSKATKNIVEKGIPYFTSVGNLAPYHYKALFDDSKKPNGIHEFSYDPKTNTIDETLEFTDEADSYGRILLQWDQDDPSGGWVSTDDIDLYLLDPNTLDWNNPIAKSTTIQNGVIPPYEFIISPLNGKFSLVIKRKNPTYKAARKFHLFLYPMTNLEYSDPYGSIINNNDAGGVGALSVGAIDINPPDKKTRDKYNLLCSNRVLIEKFSSRGPTDDARLKPEISTYDGDRTSVPGFDPFYGTSAAVAKVAGVAALMLAINPNLTPYDISVYMKKYATDLYIPNDPDYTQGEDYISGAGRLEAYPMLQEIFYKSLPAGDPKVKRVKTFTFNTIDKAWYDANDSWVKQTIGFAPPDFKYENGCLILKSRNNTSCYGSWISKPVYFENTPGGVSPVLFPGKIYEARFLIKTNAGPANFPTFRLRMGSVDNAFAVTKVVNSISNPYIPYPEGTYAYRRNNEESPGIEGSYFYLYMIPPQSSYNLGLYAAVDLMNFDVNDKSDAVLFIDEVMITEKTFMP